MASESSSRTHDIRVDPVAKQGKIEPLMQSV